jgi:hypothetical protein
MFWAKCHSIKENFIVAICDKNLLGKKIGNKLKVKVEEKFYGGEIIDNDKALELMKKANICNLLGKEIVKLAIEKKFITKENIIFIGEISHAQFIK